MKTRLHILSFFFILLTFTLYGQQFGSNVIDGGQTPEAENPDGSNKVFSPDVSVSLGSSFSSVAPGYNVFGSFIMPEITFPVNRKFAVKTGFAYSTLFYPNSTVENTSLAQSFHQYGSVYVSGLYRVTDKFTIAGTAYKTFPLTEQTPQANPRALDFSNEGIMVDMEYKFSNNFSINAGFSYQKYNPYNYFYNPGAYDTFGSPFSSPFGSSPFGRGF